MANNSGKGAYFEYLICRIFNQQGYFVRRSIPLLTKHNQTITDIDVIGILFSHPFKKRVLICDCKNKTKPKPYERIFWAKGLADYISADDIYVAVPKLSEDVIDFAKKSGINVISQEVIQKYNNDSGGYSDYNYFSDYFINLENDLKKNVNLNKFATMLSEQYLNSNPYISVNVALNILKEVSKLLNEKNNNIEIIKYLVSESTILLAYCMLSICSDTFGMKSEERSKFIIEKLTYGNFNPAYINNLVENITSYANEVIKASVPKEYLKDTKMIEPIAFEHPSYANNFVGLIDRFYANPDYYIDIVNNLDFIFYEFVIKNNKFNKEKFNIFIKDTLYEEKLKACKNIIVFACGSVKIDLNILWESEKDFVPSKKV